MKVSSCVISVAAAICLLAIGCRTTKVETSGLEESGLQVGGLKGASAVEMAIRTRIFSQTQTQTQQIYYLGSYVGDFSASGLLSLMGGYSANLGTSTLKNAAPNSVNMMLWRIAMIGSSKFIAGIACQAGGAAYLDPHFAAATKPFCGLGAAPVAPGPGSGSGSGSSSGSSSGSGSGSASSALALAPMAPSSPPGQPADAVTVPFDHAAALKSLWLSVMRYDAPQSEMNAWIDEMTQGGGPLDTLTSTNLVAILIQSMLMNPYFLMLH